MKDLKNDVEKLIRKAGKAKKAQEALTYSLAASNAASALRNLNEIRTYLPPHRQKA